ncbi:hypothetical protein Cni_G14404 [Canna indica]|uniref:Cytochrome b5 heme-binding domain-containing protein n=1 Tax=Canna indica TaxID=4628 RepID=A0AAQ3KE68_9LILI|nr:hypothetical protein Cni_G14404 [Canna indica]
MADPKVFHFDEVAKHKDAKDCWLIISGKVCLLGSSHPSPLFAFFLLLPRSLALCSLSSLPTLGDSYLSMPDRFLRSWILVLEKKGPTDDFEDIGHSNSAKVQMNKYYIGEIDSSTVPSTPAVQPLNAAKRPDDSSEFMVKVLQFLVPMMILGLAFAVRHFTKVD